MLLKKNVYLGDTWWHLSFEVYICFYTLIDNISFDITQTFSIYSTTISAPGKALIAGGYLVLEQPNIGVTISSTSRFYSTVQLQVFAHLIELEFFYCARESQSSPSSSYKV